jgi:hypothetical protein
MQVQTRERPGIFAEVAAEATTVSGRQSRSGADVVILDPEGADRVGKKSLLRRALRYAV